MITHELSFNKILRDAGRLYQYPPGGPACPSDAALREYVYRELPQETYREIAEHIQQCEGCRARVLRMEVDQREWEYDLNAAYQAELETFVGLPEPLYASMEPITMIAEYYVELPETRLARTAYTPVLQKSKEFHTELGEISLKWSWGEQEDGETAFIWLSWEADLQKYEAFSIRLIHPETREIRFEVPGETIREADEGTFKQDTLGFNPVREPWDLSLVVFKRTET